MTQLIYYLNLSKQQRLALIIIIVGILLVSCYLQKFLLLTENLYQARVSLNQTQAIFNQQKNMLMQANSVKTQNLALSKKLQQHENDNSILQAAASANITEITLEPNDDKTIHVKLESNWKQFINFLSAMATVSNCWQLQQLNIKQIDHNLVIDIQAEPPAILNSNNKPNAEITNDPNNLFTLENQEHLNDSININETEWLGTLHNGTQTLAFLKLPDQQIVGLAVGQSYGKSHWKILAIQEQKIYLQDIDTLQKIIKDIH